MVHGNRLKLKLDPQDSLELLQRPFEPNEVSLVKRLIKPGDTVIDIGANIGYYTVLFSDLAGPNGQVIAFEPDRQNAEILGENIILNRCNNITVHGLAVGRETGSIRLHHCQGNAGMHRTYDSICCGTDFVEIDCVSLDDFLNHSTQVDFIKMDIEGAEYSALQGMSQILSQDNLFLLVEFSPFALTESGSKTSGFINLLTSYGFTIYNVGRRLERLDVQDIQSRAKLFDEHASSLIKRDKCENLSEFGAHLEASFEAIGHPFEILQNWLCVKGDLAKGYLDSQKLS